MTLSPSQLQILQHSLGVDEFGQGPMCRNHFCAGASDEPDCRALVTLGLMQEHRTTEVFSYYNCSVTAAGRKFVLENSPKPPALTRSQRRYREFLRADTGCSFIEWLRDMAAWRQRGEEERSPVLASEFEPYERLHR